jgi:hypothetical protein
MISCIFTYTKAQLSRLIIMTAKSKDIFIVLFMCLFTLSGTMAQDAPDAVEPTTESSLEADESASDTNELNEDEEPEDTIESLTEDLIAYEGLFTLYHNEENGEVMMLISESQLDLEFIYFNYAINGLTTTPFMRGRYGSEKVLKIRKSYENIEFLFENPNFYFSPESPLSRADNANIGYAIVSSSPIVKHDKELGRILIDATDIFKSEDLIQLSYAASEDDFDIGSMSRRRSTITNVSSYPENTDIRLEFTFSNPMPRSSGGPAIADDRNVSIYIQHSLIQMPDNNYRPRLTDYRLGYFANEITDLTQDDPTPYRDLVSRWHLEKQNPRARLSDPVEPIVWWIENTTPYEFRDAVAEGVLAWNAAFEKIGYRNAIEVKVQPDDADWDAGDIRYNVLSWSSSPQPAFSGYGPSFTNPRTGEIIAADIMLEFAGTLRRLQFQQVLDNLDGSTYQSFEQQYCTHAFDKQVSLGFGRLLQQGIQINGEDEAALIRQFLMDLVMHEVGHTLGLSHNFGGTFLLSPDESYDNNVTKNGILYSSVMDYTDIHISPGRDNDHYFNTAVGPYDDWVIEYAYSDSLDGTEDEAQRLDNIARRSNQPFLLFGTDDHNMSSPGYGSDPRIQWYDMSNDPIGYADDRMNLIARASNEVLDKFLVQGESYHEIKDAYIILLAQYSRAANVISKYVGGVEIHRSTFSPDALNAPLVPTTYQEQKRAMTILRNQVFAPNALSFGQSTYDYLLSDRRLWDVYASSEDPKIREWTLDIQRGVLLNILNPRVMNRISDSMSYGNTYSINEVMADLTDALFQDDLTDTVILNRQDLQSTYIEALAYLLNESPYTDYQSLAAILTELKRVQGLLSAKLTGDASTRAHTNYILFFITKTLEEYA